MARALNIAYLTSTYARASDSFIRIEVEHLRKLGHTVRTFSIRRSPEQEMVSDDIRREREQTTFILTRENAGGLITAAIGALVRSPGRLLATAGLAVRSAPPGLKGAVWGMAYLVEACFLAKQLRANSIEHLHDHFGEGSASVAMLAAKLAGIPYSLTIHGSAEFDRAPGLALDRKVAHSAFIAAVSHFGRSQIMRWCSVDDWDKIKIVRCAVADHFLTQGREPLPARRQFVFVGRLDTMKGLLPLVEAVRILAGEGREFKLIVVGDGPMRAAVAEKIKRYQLQERITLRGWMSSEDVQREILAATAFVLPSFAENLPVAIMEALALGRPVITTYIGGIPELVRNDVCGWLVPPSSVTDLVAAMRDVLDAPQEQLEQMGAAGAKLVAARHDPIQETLKLSEHFGDVHRKKQRSD